MSNAYWLDEQLLADAKAAGVKIIGGPAAWRWVDGGKTVIAGQIFFTTPQM